MTTDRHDLTDADVWNFVSAGCNPHEIATFAGVALSAARAMIAHATRTYSTAVAA